MNGTPHTCFKMALVLSFISGYSPGIPLLFHFLKGYHTLKKDNGCVHTSFLNDGGLDPVDTMMKRGTLR